MTLKQKINFPNTLTALRILGTGCLLLFPPHSVWFITIYTLAGFTDVLDGYIARKMGQATEFGAKLDSAADLVYYTVMLLRIFPILWVLLPWQIWLLVGAVLAVRLSAYVAAAVKYHRFASQHTWMNKATGLMVFAVPYLIATPVGVGFCWAIAVVGLLASVEELLLHLCAKEYDSRIKSILPFLIRREQLQNP